MNVPQQNDITPMTTLLKQLMDQKEPDSPIHIPPSLMLSAPPPQTPAKSPGVSPPNAMPQILRITSGEASTPLPNGTMSIPGSNSHKSFSFSKMKDSLGKKSESIRKKIITATNEWKRENSNGSASQYSVASDIFATATDAIRRSNPTETVSFSLVGGDPLRSPSSPPHSSHMMPVPPSPLKHQHARWAQGLHERILVLQNYLMSIEEAANNSQTESSEGKVPSQVWEAMADMQRMQQELYNYSVNMS